MARSLTSPAFEIAEAQALWAPSAPYLNTASYGLPPRPAWDELQTALGDWRRGRGTWESWNETTQRARAAFARLVAAETENVATGPTVSQLVSVVAATLRPRTRVVAPENDFASLLFPLAVQTEVTTVPLAGLVEAIDAETDLVAVSAVQSATGELADLEALREATREHEALLLVDATQACGWLPVTAAQADFLVCGAYKWLMSPRGTAFMAVAPELLGTLRPIAANWWSAEEPYGMYYGLPPRLAEDARRLDLSPAWFSWVGTAPSLEVILRIGVEAIHDHDVSLANRFRAGLGLPTADSAIVLATVPEAETRLAEAGISAAVRAGTVRVSFHVYNTEEDVDAALTALLD